VAEANGVWHRQMVGAGGKQWEFKLKAAEANGGQQTQMAAEASGGCQMNGGWQKQMVCAGASGGRQR